MKTHTVRGGGGLRLHVREWGNAGRAADPVHPRLVAEPPLLGEAVRERARRRVPARRLRPPRPRHVRGAARARALHRRQALGRRRGGDHRRAAASTGRCSSAGRTAPSSSATTCARTARIEIAAINFVEGAAKLGEAAFGTLIGPGFLDHFVDATADDLPTNIRAMRSFVRACLVKPVSDDDLETAVCWNVAVPAAIRANLAAREID